jgi:hypothetical protein
MRFGIPAGKSGDPRCGEMMDPGARIEENLIPLPADLQADIEPVQRGVVSI